MDICSIWQTSHLSHFLDICTIWQAAHQFEFFRVRNCFSLNRCRVAQLIRTGIIGPYGVFGRLICRWLTNFTIEHSILKAEIGDSNHQPQWDHSWDFDDDRFFGLSCLSITFVKMLHRAGDKKIEERELIFVSIVYFDKWVFPKYKWQICIPKYGIFYKMLIINRMQYI